MPSLEQTKKSDWYKSVPQIIKDLCCQFPAGSSVVIKSTQCKAYVHSWGEDGNINVILIPAENKEHFAKAGFTEPYQVFGLMPDDLEFLHENPDLCLPDILEKDFNGTS